MAMTKRMVVVPYRVFLFFETAYDRFWFFLFDDDDDYTHTTPLQAITTSYSYTFSVAVP
jgi:hypothetical protein